MKNLIIGMLTIILVVGFSTIAKSQIWVAIDVTADNECSVTTGSINCTFNSGPHFAHASASYVGPQVYTLSASFASNSGQCYIHGITDNEPGGITPIGTIWWSCYGTSYADIWYGNHDADLHLDATKHGAIIIE